MQIDQVAREKAIRFLNYEHKDVASRAIEVYEAAKEANQASGASLWNEEVSKGLKFQPNEQPDEEWEDKPDQWQEAIDNAHPTKTGKHKTYAMALDMVGNRHSKGALVDLVNWLLAYRRPHVPAEECPECHANREARMQEDSWK